MTESAGLTRVFSSLDFSLKPEQILKITDVEIGKLLPILDSIGKLSESPASVTLENSLLRLEIVLAEFSNSLSIPVFLKYVSPDPAVRQAADTCETRLQKLMVDVFTREDLYRSVAACEPMAEKLSASQKLLLEDYLSSFRRNGLGLSADQRAKFIETKKRLVEIEAEFHQNLVKENQILEFTPAELEGLPAPFIDSLEKTPEGKCRITMAYPHITPIMENAVKDQTRRTVSSTFNRRGGERNKKLLEEALVLRDRLAKMLSFDSHAHFVLDRRMARKPEAVREFLSKLKDKLQILAKKELEGLQKVKKQLFPTASSEISAHEWRFLHNKVLKANYDLDPNEVQQYFPMDKVITGLFEVYQTLFSVTFKELKGQPVWHSSVRKFQVIRDGKPISDFYMDLYPREGKYSHAAAFTLVSGRSLSGNLYQAPAAAIVANFSPPTEKAPSLLLHSEVETLFHEFGHIMHQILTEAEFATFSGTNVKTDFVEAPSQMLENWTWNEEILGLISEHHVRKGEKLPKEMIQKMLAAKNLNVGLYYLRQLAFATIDLDMHSGNPVPDSTKLYAERMKEIMLIPILEGTYPQASFGHLMGGYDAGYYGYLWSEVFAEDMFGRFDAEGLLNPQTGKDYVEWILSPGGEKLPHELIKGFLKRDPTPEAFLKGLGLDK